jgi:hypothetical protein
LNQHNLATITHTHTHTQTHTDTHTHTHTHTHTSESAGEEVHIINIVGEDLAAQLIVANRLDRPCYATAGRATANTATTTAATTAAQ